MAKKGPGRIELSRRADVAQRCESMGSSPTDRLGGLDQLLARRVVRPRLHIEQEGRNVVSFVFGLAGALKKPISVGGQTGQRNRQQQIHPGASEVHIGSDDRRMVAVQPNASPLPADAGLHTKLGRLMLGPSSQRKNAVSLILVTGCDGMGIGNRFEVALTP